MKTVSPESKEIPDLFSAKFIEEGIEQGIEQGLLTTAINMIKKGYSTKQIAEITDLSIDRIESLCKENRA